MFEDNIGQYLIKNRTKQKHNKPVLNLCGCRKTKDWFSHLLLNQAWACICLVASVPQGVHKRLKHLHFSICGAETSQVYKNIWVFFYCLDMLVFGLVLPTVVAVIEVWEWMKTKNNCLLLTMCCASQDLIQWLKSQQLPYFCHFTTTIYYFCLFVCFWEIK